MDRETFSKGDSPVVFRAMLRNLKQNSREQQSMTLPPNGDVTHPLLATAYAMDDGRVWVHVVDATGNSDTEMLTVYTFGED